MVICRKNQNIKINIVSCDLAKNIEVKILGVSCAALVWSDHEWIFGCQLVVCLHQSEWSVHVMDLCLSICCLSLCQSENSVRFKDLCQSSGGASRDDLEIRKAVEVYIGEDEMKGEEDHKKMCLFFQLWPRCRQRSINQSGASDQTVCMERNSRCLDQSLDSVFEFSVTYFPQINSNLSESCALLK